MNYQETVSTEASYFTLSHDYTEGHQGGITCGRTMVMELSAHTTSTLLLASTLDTWPTDV